MPDLSVQWERIAEPQADHYDSDVTLRFARQRGYRPAQWAGGSNLLGGKVSIAGNNYWGAPLVPAQVDHPNVVKACDILAQWPAAFEQCQRLLSVIYISADPSFGPYRRGSISGPGPSGFGSVCVTIEDPLGAAEGILHEMAHHKLRALGVGVTAAERLITNPPGDLFHSPIRYDKLRPMPAILHAEYSYTYVVGLELKVIDANDDVETKTSIARHSLAGYLPKLTFGLDVIASRAQTDADGKQFLHGYIAWVERVLDKGYRALRKLGVSPIEFQHPLGQASSNR